GALITGLSNEETAKIIGATVFPTGMQAVLYFHDIRNELVALRADNTIVPFSECGIRPKDYFIYYDHIHTTGADVPQSVTLHGILTLNDGVVLRDYFQAAMRLRGLGNHQRFTIVVPASLG